MSEPESVRSITRRFVENYRRKRFLAMVADREFVEEPLPAVLEQIWAEAEMPLSGIDRKFLEDCGIQEW